MGNSVTVLVDFVSIVLSRASHLGDFLLLLEHQPSLSSRCFLSFFELVDLSLSTSNIRMCELIFILLEI